MANQWFRMYAEFSADAKVQMMPESFQRRLLMLMCFRCNGDVTLHDEEIAFLLRISNEEWWQTKSVFLEKGFINESNELLNWEKRQFSSDSSAERVRRHREYKKQGLKDNVTTCNVTVTPQNRTEQIQNRTDTEQNRTDISADKSALVTIQETVTDEFCENGKIEITKQPRENIPVARIVDLYHEILPELPRVEKLTKTRIGYIQQRWREDMDGLEYWQNFFRHIRKSKFLMGQAEAQNGKPPFIADLEWITRPSNFAKIAEDKYHRKPDQPRMR